MKDHGRRIDIPVIDIKGLLTRPIDLLKLGVEGHEYVLLDVSEITPDKIRSMVIEFHEMDGHIADCERLFSRFSAAGYRIDFAENPDVDASQPENWQGTHIVRIYAV